MSVTFGAVQFASGSSLSASLSIAATAQANSVNRSLKSDRSQRYGPNASERTISLNLAGMNDTSVLVRIPVTVPAKKASDGSIAPKASASMRRHCRLRTGRQRLTDVAKFLSPGRCMT